MGLEGLKTAIPEYAKDLRLNLGSVITTSSLPPAAAWGAALAAALVSKNKALISAVGEDAAGALDARHLDACRSAAAIMGMNNVWYRFVHAIEDEEVKKLPARLRMNVMLNAGGVDKGLFEAWSLAASVVNGCSLCVNAHAGTLRQHGMTAQNVHDVARIAAVVKAVADTLTFHEMAG